MNKQKQKQKIVELFDSENTMKEKVKEFLYNKGIGSGTNITTNMVINLIVGFVKENSKDFLLTDVEIDMEYPPHWTPTMNEAVKWANNKIKRRIGL